MITLQQANRKTKDAVSHFHTFNMSTTYNTLINIYSAVQSDMVMVTVVIPQ